MNVNVKCRLMWVLAFLLAAPWAMAQKDIPPYGFAGEDFTVMLPSSANSDGSFLITLGLKEDIYDGDDSYYEWHLEDAPYGFNFSEELVFPAQHNGGDIHRHSIQAMVLNEGEYEFSLTRLSKYGYQRECVLVTVRVFPKIMSATPKKHCYDFGDVVSIEDFDIETDPPGPEYEKLISIKNPNVLQNYRPMISHGFSIPVDVYFLCKNLRNEVQESDFYIQIDLENQLRLSLDGNFVQALENYKNFFSGNKNASDAEIEQLKKDFKEAAKYIESYHKLTKLSPKLGGLLHKFINGKLPIKPVYGITITDALETQCCNEEWGLYLSLGALSGELGVEVDIPVQLPIGLYVPIYFKAVAQLNLDPFYVSLYPFKECGHAPEKLELKFNVEGGSGIGVGAPTAAGVDIRVIAGGGVPYTFYFSSDKENGWGKPDWYVDLAVTITTPTFEFPFRLNLVKSKP